MSVSEMVFKRRDESNRKHNIRQSSVTKIVCKQTIKKQPQQLSSIDWSTNLLLKAFYIHVKVRKQKKMELSTTVPEANDISI